MPRPINPQHRETFRTHANYLRAFARLVGPNTLEVQNLEPLAQMYQRIPQAGGTCSNHAGAWHSLMMAWRTEMVLDLTTAALEDDELCKIANTWAVVQVYYVLYHATQALAQTKGFNRTPNHSQTQKLFNSLWTDRSALLPPLTLSWGDGGARNIPDTVVVDDSIHAWTACDGSSCWSLAAKALRTTREDAIDEAFANKRAALLRERKKEWRAEEEQRLAAGRRARREPQLGRPQLSPAQKIAIARNVRSHTIIDYLYRLRIRTNYEDAAMFTDGPEEIGESVGIRDCLRQISSAALLLHELAVADVLGREALIAQAREFLQSAAPSGVQVTLRSRFPLLETYARH